MFCAIFTLINRNCPIIGHFGAGRLHAWLEIPGGGLSVSTHWVHLIGTTIPRIGSVSSEMDLEILFCGGGGANQIN